MPQNVKYLVLSCQGAALSVQAIYSVGLELVNFTTHRLLSNSENLLIFYVCFSWCVCWFVEHIFKSLYSIHFNTPEHCSSQLSLFILCFVILRDVIVTRMNHDSMPRDYFRQFTLELKNKHNKNYTFNSPFFTSKQLWFA